MNCSIFTLRFQGRLIDMIESDWILDKRDIFTEELFQPLDEEVEGTTPDMCWVQNVDTGEYFLFKPNTFGGNESYNEYVAYNLATRLGISCARVMVGEMFGKVGCLSHRMDGTLRYRVSDGYSLHRCDQLFNNEKPDSDGLVYDSNVELSFKGLLPYVSEETATSLIRMMFLDCIIKNCDRHPGNYSFYINWQRIICQLAPLYDHGLSLGSASRDTSLFPYEGMGELSFKDLFSVLRENHIEIVGPLLERLLGDNFSELLKKLWCEQFILDRLEFLGDNSRVRKASWF